MFALTCGACGVTAKLDAADPVSGWACPACANVNVSSLPTTPSGKLVAQAKAVDSALPVAALVALADVVPKPPDPLADALDAIVDEVKG